MLRTNDNFLMLALSVVALSWWQCATIPAVGAAVPPGDAGVKQTAPVGPQLAAPLLPGQIGVNYDEAMHFGDIFYARKVYLAAAENYRAALRYKPTPIAHVGLGYALAGTGQDEEAMAEYFEALKLDGHYAPARYALGLMFMKKESWDEAAGQFLQVLQLYPHDIGSRGSLAICYMQKGQLDTAIEQLKYLSEAAPNSLEAHYNLACAYDLKHDWDSALAEYRKSIQLNPRYSQAYAAMANCLMNKHEFKAAEVTAKQAIKIDPKNYYAYISLGRVYELMNREKDAVEQYKRAISIDPKAPECKQLIANMMKAKAQKLGLNNLPGLTY